MKVLEIVWQNDPVAEKVFQNAEVTVANIHEDLTFPEGEFDIVFCAHVLQLVDRNEIRNLLTGMTDHLREYGELWVITPDIEWACEEILKHNFIPPVLATIFGNGTPHRMGFTLWALRDLVEQQGMIIRQAFQGPYMLGELQVPQNTVIGLKVIPDPGDSIKEI